jgi:hypothetical protein
MSLGVDKDRWAGRVAIGNLLSREPIDVPLGRRKSMRALRCQNVKTPTPLASSSNLRRDIVTFRGRLKVVVVITPVQTLGGE